jgi:hypothetical protein
MAKFSALNFRTETPGNRGFAFLGFGKVAFGADIALPPVSRHLGGPPSKRIGLIYAACPPEFSPTNPRSSSPYGGPHSTRANAHGRPARFVTRLPQKLGALNIGAHRDLKSANDPIALQFSQASAQHRRLKLSALNFGTPTNQSMDRRRPSPPAYGSFQRRPQSKFSALNWVGQPCRSRDSRRRADLGARSVCPMLRIFGTLGSAHGSKFSALNWVSPPDSRARLVLGAHRVCHWFPRSVTLVGPGHGSKFSALNRVGRPRRPCASRRRIELVARVYPRILRSMTLSAGHGSKFSALNRVGRRPYRPCASRHRIELGARVCPRVLRSVTLAGDGSKFSALNRVGRPCRACAPRRRIELGARRVRPGDTKSVTMGTRHRNAKFSALNWHCLPELDLGAVRVCPRVPLPGTLESGLGSKFSALDWVSPSGSRRRAVHGACRVCLRVPRSGALESGHGSKFSALNRVGSPDSRRRVVDCACRMCLKVPQVLDTGCEPKFSALNSLRLVDLGRSDSTAKRSLNQKKNEGGPMPPPK